MSDYSTSFSEIFQSCSVGRDGDPAADIAEDVAEALYERLEDFPPMTEWPPAVRNFYVLYDLNMQVGNGGLAQVVYNIPELLPAAIQAYQDLGLPAAANLCSQLIAMLPAEFSEYISKGIDDDGAIDDVFKHFRESEVAQLDDQIPDEFFVEERLNEYAIENRDQFVSLDNPTGG